MNQAEIRDLVLGRVHFLEQGQANERLQSCVRHPRVPHVQSL